MNSGLLYCDISFKFSKTWALLEEINKNLQIIIAQSLLRLAWKIMVFVSPLKSNSVEKLVLYSIYNLIDCSESVGKINIYTLS